MRIAAVMQDHVEVALRFGRKCGEKLLGEFAIKLANPFAFEALHAPYKRRTAAKIDRHGGQHFVHGKRGPAIAGNSRPVAKRAFERAAEHEADVFYGVVAIDFGVAVRGDVEIEHAVARKRVEHVGEKRYGCDDGAGSHTIEVELDGDLGLFGVALDARSTRHDSLYQLPTDRTTIAMAHTRALLLLLLAACGGGTKNPALGPQTGSEHASSTQAGAGQAGETKRESSAAPSSAEILPAEGNCLPAKLKTDSSLHLELASIGKDPIVCAVDTEATRLAGPVGCWKVDLSKLKAESVPLVRVPAAPLPNRNVDALLSNGCAHGLCLPKTAKPTSTNVVHLAWNHDGAHAAMLVGDEVHLFDAATKAHQSSFSVRGAKGVANDAVEVFFVGKVVFVVGADAGQQSGVWAFKVDGTPIGPIQALGGKAKTLVSPYRGSFSVLDPGHVAIAERGMETLTTYEVDTGRRIKSVRKLPKNPCKPDEIDAFWHDSGKVTKKCRIALESASGMFVGATAVMGSMNLLVALQGARLGELAVIEPKSLAERRKPLKMPWCEAE